MKIFVATIGFNSEDFKLTGVKLSECQPRCPEWVRHLQRQMLLLRKALEEEEKEHRLYMFQVASMSTKSLA